VRLYRDLYFNPGGRLRISAGGGSWLWIRWGWRAEWQLMLRRANWEWRNVSRCLHIEGGFFSFSRYRH
jgi:hypothetical protein